MTRIRTLKSNFTAGELSETIFGRVDLSAYENGARRLRNVFIHPTGGVTRRDGLRFIAQAAGDGRLVAFEFNTEQTYLLVFTDESLAIRRADGTLVDAIATPWTLEQVRRIRWAQSADTLLVVHPDVPPKQITRTLDGMGQEVWQIADWSFIEEESRDADDNLLGDALRQPYYKFAANDVTLTPSGTARGASITVTASAPVFDDAHVGLRFQIERRQIEITSKTSDTEVQATVKETLKSTDPAKDWEEPSFSSLRGHPRSVVFHQDRLVIGGSRDMPNRLWLSKSGELFNFDLGEGLDDEAIEFAILSDQVNAIQHVFSGRTLQVLTSGAEWMVSGDPLTPESIQVKRQTQVGSMIDRNVPPRDVDGATLFAARNGRELREFLFADVEQAYQANDLAILARHVLQDPVDQDYDKARRLFHIVTADGALATVTVFRAEQVTAWSRQTTAGAFKSVAVVDRDAFVLVERNGAFLIERFEAALNTDSAVTAEADPATAAFAGLDHLEGETVKVLADGSVEPDATVASGAVALGTAASEIEAGLPFTHEIEPLPPAVRSPRGSSQGMPLRLIEATFRLLDTRAFNVDLGRGPRPVPFKRFGDAGILDAGAPSFTGDVTVRSIGWRQGGVEPLWRIEGDSPLPVTLLAVTTEVKIND